MRFPEFFEQAPVVRVRDPLAAVLGAPDDGAIEYRYADAVRLAGHSCPTVASAFLMGRAALAALYPADLPERGSVAVRMPVPENQATTGVTAQVLQSDLGGIDVEGDGFTVDAALLARLLDVPASDVQTLMREGRITSLCEQGVEEHADQFRLTFFHGNRRACVRVDPAGRVLTRSIIDFGSKAASRAICDAASRELPGLERRGTRPISSSAAVLRRAIARQR